MPVTTKPSLKSGTNQDKAMTIDTNGRSIFDRITSKCISPHAEDPRRKSKDSSGRGFSECPIIASSICPKKTEDKESIDETVTVSVSWYDNGFVEGIMRAFNQDLDLVIRPDDVWQAILSQFSLFINGRGNAERLRHKFVSHEGKKTLDLDLTATSLSELDFSKVAQEFTSLIQENVVDPELREWMLPNFSTTTDHDKAVAAFSMMGAMQKYFEYGMCFGCGFPSVTLLGTRNDWEKLERRVDKLDHYGKECKDWAHLLRPIMDRMKRTFDEPDSKEIKDFWLNVAWETADSHMSGDPLKISGWITAFAYFNDNGSVAQDDYVGEQLELGGVVYPIIHPNHIPSSLVMVPITMTDLEAGVRTFSTAIAGTIGMSISGGSKSQPFSAWWVVQEFEESI
ncbi:uncharacterized protein Triagg1_157 [Trichoderma aggressivum f. europaeum]|uniref:Uncharacterized protein n=1 Tax=Trichoderma aggressivum f. europaeum TaxID=173218 RepID=A0AAE1IJW8_9HYPO|nr:hypothetical protein Triagg1_157 [Trichoderma aggressivum f. europaeum]